MLEKNIRYVIKMNPMIDTRELIAFFAASGIKKQRVCGYLSSLKRKKQIKIVTIKPGRCSLAV